MNGAKKREERKIWFKFTAAFSSSPIFPLNFPLNFHWNSIDSGWFLNFQLFHHAQVAENIWKWREMVGNGGGLPNSSFYRRTGRQTVDGKQWTANSWQLESGEQEESGLWIGDCEDSAQRGGVRSDEFPAESLAESLACWSLIRGLPSSAPHSVKDLTDATTDTTAAWFHRAGYC